MDYLQQNQSKIRATIIKNYKGKVLFDSIEKVDIFSIHDKRIKDEIKMMTPTINFTEIKTIDMHEIDCLQIWEKVYIDCYDSWLFLKIKLFYSENSGFFIELEH